MTEETTLRVLAARRKLTKTKIREITGLSNNTINKMYDEIPDGMVVGKLRHAAEKLGLKLVVRFEESGE